ncbi:acetate--CoA ligase family protein [Streptomyces sp. NPDC041003]|uniref:acetate--CoA ligase family protein n=1 Tax=Streptomyces sp. NPDC041003 TaxID=3155730 RepID=UPI0033E741DC
MVAAACRDAGVELVRTPREMTVVLAALSAGPGRPRTKGGASGARTAVFTDGGGHGAIAADAAEDAGLGVPELDAATQARLRTVLWEQSAVGNPVDLAGMGEQQPLSYAGTVAELLAADEVDAVLMTGYFGGYAASDGGLGGGPAGGSVLAEGETLAAEKIVTHLAAAPKPLVVQSMYPQSPSCRVLAGAGVPVFAATEDAARALSAMTGRAGGGAGELPEFPALPDPAAPLRDAGYHGVRTLLAAGGVPFPAAREITDEAGLLAAAGEFEGPYVLKALHLLHKSDAGGVALRLADREALLAAYREMHGRLGAPAYSVEAMADLSDGIELIVGVNRDPRFGPVAMVGLGGVLTETLRDVAFALAPVPAGRAEALLRGLRTAALLDGVRGRPAVDVAAAAAVIERITTVAAAHPEIAELEVNPLLVRPDGALALDARAVLG